MTVFSRVSAFIGGLVFLACVPVARSQQEFPPPQGNGRVVVLASGLSGPGHYKEVSAEIAKLGYDVVLFDGNAEENTKGVRVKADIQTAKGMPHAMPGKVALVGFSLGGGEEMFYGTGPMSAEEVAVGIFWYPANAFIKDLAGYANRLSVPVLVFAGGKDHFRNGCCTAEHDGEIRDASKAAGKMYEVTVYPDADHDFVKGGDHFNPKDYANALMHTADALKMYLGN
jgi:dienelactone hydrolase